MQATPGPVISQPPSPLQTPPVSPKPGLGIFAWIRLFMFPFLVVIGLEIIARGAFVEPFRWAWQQPLAVLFNVTLITAAFCAMLGAFSRLRIAAVVLVLVLFAVAMVNGIKVRTLGLPLFPWDIWLTRQAVEIPNVFQHEFKSQVRDHAVPIALLIGVTGFALWLPKGRLKLKMRGLLLLLSGGVITCFVFYGKTPLAGAIKNITWDQRENYQTNGMCLAFTINAKTCLVAKPPNYSEERFIAMSQANRSARGNSGVTSRPDQSQQPDLIIVMSEALWDPTLLPGVTFSPDPLKNIRGLSPGGQLQTVISPTFGGGTCNVEFELLTGMNMALLPEGAIPYQQYISSHVPSLVSLLKSRGYRATAVHPYFKWYWNREQVYRHLGFDKFLSQDEMTHREIKGSLISDQSVMEEIDSLLGGDQPAFVFAITMENHWPYFSGKNVNTQLEIRSRDLDDDTKYLFDNYCRGVMDSDQSLGWLVERLRARKRPAVLAFFGDHLPAMGDDYLAYRETGFLEKDTGPFSPAQSMKMSRVPVLLWDSAKGGQPVPEVSICFLGPVILEQLGGGLSNYHRFVQELSRQVPVLQRRFHSRPDGSLYPGRPDTGSGPLADYWLLQYDLLFGRSYAARLFDN